MQQGAAQTAFYTTFGCRFTVVLSKVNVTCTWSIFSSSQNSRPGRPQCRQVFVVFLKFVTCAETKPVDTAAIQDWSLTPLIKWFRLPHSKAEAASRQGQGQGAPPARWRRWRPSCDKLTEELSRTEEDHSQLHRKYFNAFWSRSWRRR